jgi:hypothetical protein
VHVMPGASLVFAAGSNLTVGEDCSIVLHGNARLDGSKRTLKKARKRKRIKLIG